MSPKSTCPTGSLTFPGQSGSGIYQALLSPGRCHWDFKGESFKHNFGVDMLGIQINLTLEWMPEDLIHGQSTLIEVMAWCHSATSHYLNQCWPEFLCHMASLGHNELTPLLAVQYFIHVEYSTEWQQIQPLSFVIIISKQWYIVLVAMRNTKAILNSLVPPWEMGLQF